MPLYKNVTKELKSIQFRLNGTMMNKTIGQGKVLNLPFFISQKNLPNGIELVDESPMENFVLFSENIKSENNFIINELDIDKKIELYKQTLRVYSKNDVKMYINFNKQLSKDENNYIFIPQNKIFEKQFSINYLKYLQFESKSKKINGTGIDVEISLIKEFQFTY